MSEIRNPTSFVIEPYKHVVLGLIFLKYVSDSFTERYNAVQEWKNGRGFRIRL